MSTGTRKRRPNAVLGYLKVVGMLFVMLFLLPVWLVRESSPGRGSVRSSGRRACRRMRRGRFQTDTN